MAFSQTCTPERPIHGSQPGLILFLLMVSLIRGCLYAALVPPWQAPDENGHFEYAWLIAHLGRWPRPGETSPAFESELLSSLYEWRYGDYIGRPLPSQMPAQLGDLPGSIFAVGSRSALGRFSPAYIWAALFIWPFRHQDLLLQLYAARFASVMLNLGVVYLAWRIFEQLMPHQPELVAAMTAFVIFLPQHTFINASVGEGPLAELCACAVFYGWLRLFRQGRIQDITIIVAGTLLGLWTKKTVAFLLPLNVVMAIVFLWNTCLRQVGRERIFWTLMSIGVLILVGWSAWQMPSGRWVYDMLEGWWAAPRLYWENEQFSLGEALRDTFESFWAQFGWMSARAEDGWYLLIYVLVLFAIEGWAFPRSRFWAAPPWAIWLLAGALLLAVAGFVAFMIATPYGLHYYQGRYLFPVTVPVAFFIIGGWARWTPARWLRYFPQVAIALLAVLDMMAVALTLLPYFYGDL